jgi:hypothetical protein
MNIKTPEKPKDRFEVYRFFNGISSETKEGLNIERTRIPLVKSFLLEHVSSDNVRSHKTPEQIFLRLGAQTERIDETFWEVRFTVKDKQSDQFEKRTTGYLEQYDERFFAYYTIEPSVTAKQMVHRWIQEPDLDAAWFSSFLLESLWENVVSKRGDERFGKLKFSHESIFDMPEDFAQPDLSEDDSQEQETDSDFSEEDVVEEKIEYERRKSSFEMRDRIGKIKQSLKKLQAIYSPLNALISIKIPSHFGRGSHDLYQHGQITNRTDSFEDHRNTVLYLYKIYKAILELTETNAWQSKPEKLSGQSFGNNGVPLIVKFGEELSPATFENWITKAFQKRNRFRLWGDPIRLGPTKVHVYGADRHLWQPLDMELTEKGVVAILPRGTCGNTFHRLITNIQQYVCPKIEAWLGDKRFESLIQLPADDLGGSK